MPEKLFFEEAFRLLNQKVQALEKGGLTLDEATRLFEEGVELVKQCNQLLSQAELKVEQLKEAYGDYLPSEDTEDDEEPPKS
jgi:exodeoxyribonuclease VII small subunit